MSSTLLKTTSISFAAAAVLHAHLSVKHIFPVFGPKGDSFQAYVLKIICLQLSGYFVINGTYIKKLPEDATELTTIEGILAWRWAKHGITDPFDRTVMVVLVLMNSAAGTAFLSRWRWRALRSPPAPLLLGTSAMILASQVLRKDA